MQIREFCKLRRLKIDAGERSSLRSKGVLPLHGRSSSSFRIVSFRVLARFRFSDISQTIVCFTGARTSRAAPPVNNDPTLRAGACNLQQANMQRSPRHPTAPSIATSTRGTFSRASLVFVESYAKIKVLPWYLPHPQTVLETIRRN